MLSIKNKYTISAKIINGLRPYVKIFKWHQQKDYQWLLILLWMKEEQLMKQKYVCLIFIWGIAKTR